MLAGILVSSASVLTSWFNKVWRSTCCMC